MLKHQGPFPVNICCLVNTPIKIALTFCLFYLYITALVFHCRKQRLHLLFIRKQFLSKPVINSQPTSVYFHYSLFTHSVQTFYFAGANKPLKVFPLFLVIHTQEIDILIGCRCASRWQFYCILRRKISPRDDRQGNFSGFPDIASCFHHFLYVFASRLFCKIMMLVWKINTLQLIWDR